MGHKGLWTATRFFPSLSDGSPKVKRDAGIDVGADQPAKQAEDNHGQRRGYGAIGRRYRKDEPENDQQKYSGGPNRSASSPSGGENTATTTIAIVQATKDPTAAIGSRHSDWTARSRRV